jgi:hypothetical protein
MRQGHTPGHTIGKRIELLRERFAPAYRNEIHLSFAYPRDIPHARDQRRLMVLLTDNLGKFRQRRYYIQN